MLRQGCLSRMLCCVLLLCLQASAPDVWRQLRELCLADRLGAAAIRELEMRQLNPQHAQEQEDWYESSDEFSSDGM
jgi:hypothetical protein